MTQTLRKTMMKKTLFALGLAVLLAIPAGAAMASTVATDDTSDVPPVVAVQNQERDQVRLQDSAECDGTCPNADSDGTPLMARDRERVMDPELCDGEGPLGDQHQAQLGTQYRAELGSQNQAQLGGQHQAQLGEGGFGSGPADGTGPLHEGPADGTGQQYGARGR